MSTSLQPARSRGVLSLVLALALALAAGLLAGSCARREANAAGAEPELTLYVLGGSNAWGEPYEERADLGRIVSWIFGGELGGRKIRVENRGGPGKPSAGVLDDVREIADAGPAAGTALVLLWLGGNEFLRFDTLENLLERRRVLFDDPLVVPVVAATVLETYAKNVEEILTRLQGAGIGVVAATVTANQKDWEPNRSVLRDPRNGTAVRELLAVAERARSAGSAEEELAACREILELEPSFALASKRAGDCLRALGRFDEARVCYQDAIDHDGNPYRETSAQTRILREACARHGVPLVDATRLLAETLPDGLIGYEWLWDNCHPTLAGYARIAAGFATEIERLLGEPRRRVELDLAALEEALGFDDAFRVQVLADRGKYCYVSSTLTYDSRARLERARLYLEQAHAQAPEDPELLCSMAVRELLAGGSQESLVLWRRAYALAPRVTRERAKHPYVQQVLKRCGIEDLPAMLRAGS